MKIAFQISSYFANYKVALVQFVLLPIFQISLMLLMMNYYVGNYSVKVTTATLILSGVTMGMSLISGLFVTDINLGIDRLLVVENPYSFYYWATRILFSFLTANLMVFVNMLLFLPFHLVDVYWTITLTPILVIFGIIIGLGTVFLSWRKSNPYFYTNIVRSATLILGGAILSVQAYPSVFRPFTYLLPFGRILNIIHTNNQSEWWIDVLIAFIWLLLTYIIYRYQIRRITLDK